eukprot:CAMPEP_0170499150 /NCGR_PEP_ID=MMETSP0208-20121228/30284_1 /TAXON_ID=197538 /ORGANISM="Strombidium inclinatum, Strain S3" /LENGTH=86 /DNA_ID=CAMNT_0010776589 /DNA_START=1874 /DNA_END=2131 /DNA_ORIENTATION=-
MTPILDGLKEIDSSKKDDGKIKEYIEMYKQSTPKGEPLNIGGGEYHPAKEMAPPEVVNKIKLNLGEKGVKKIKIKRPPSAAKKLKL